MCSPARMVGLPGRLFVLAAVGLLCAASPVGAADATILQAFSGGTSQGSFPVGDVTVAGGFLYGVTNLGGANDGGTIYRLNDVGGGLQLLHSFSGVSNPTGSLTLGGSTLYGMANEASGLGAIFKMQTDGSGYTEIHNFLGGNLDGKGPLGALLLSGSKLYGMTQRGGTANAGAIFSLNTDGSGFSVLHSFTGSDGSFPEGSLAISGSTLYGMATSGTGNGGVVFQLDTTGANFNVLHSFGSVADDGAGPKGALLVTGSVLYGTTNSGGSGGAGTVFKLDTSGGNYSLLHNFSGGAADGSLPSGSLTMVGSTLYGTTQSGGANDAGTVFQMNADGTGFGLVASFSGLAGDGSSPQGSLTNANGQLFGTTAGGGGPLNGGTVFSLAVVPEPGVTALLGLAAVALLGVGVRRRTCS